MKSKKGLFRETFSRAIVGIVLLGFLPLLLSCPKGIEEEIVRSALKLSGRFLDFSLGVPLGDYSLYCVTFEKDPVSGSGKSNPDGFFTVAEFPAVGKAFGCFVTNANGDPVADLLFQKKTSGGVRSSASIVLNGDTNFGDVLVDPVSKLAYVDLDKIHIPSVEEGSFFDFTGTWRFNCIPAPGYEIPQDPEVCPKEGLPVYLYRVSGKDIKTGKPRFGILLFQSERAFQSCGGVIGVTQDEILTEVAVQLDPTVPQGHFQFLPEPPSPGSWEERSGTFCSEASGKFPQDWNRNGVTGETNVYCKDLPEPAQSYCYGECFWTVKRNENLCVQDREFNWDTPTEPLSDFRSRFILYKKNPSTAFAGGITEFTYITPVTGSAVFQSEWRWQIMPGFSCWVHESVQFITGKVSSQEMVGDLVFTRVFVGSSSGECYQKVNDPSMPQWFREEGKDVGRRVRIRVRLVKE